MRGGRVSFDNTIKRYGDPILFCFENNHILEDTDVPSIVLLEDTDVPSIVLLEIFG